MADRRRMRGRGRGQGQGQPFTMQSADGGEITLSTNRSGRVTVEQGDREAGGDSMVFATDDYEDDDDVEDIEDVDDNDEDDPNANYVDDLFDPPGEMHSIRDWEAIEAQEAAEEAARQAAAAAQQAAEAAQRAAEMVANLQAQQAQQALAVQQTATRAQTIQPPAQPVQTAQPLAQSVQQTAQPPAQLVQHAVQPPTQPTPAAQPPAQRLQEQQATVPQPQQSTLTASSQAEARMSSASSRNSTSPGDESEQDMVVEESQSGGHAPRQQSIFRRNQPVVVPVPRPEFVAINRPVADLAVTRCISDENLRLWRDFFTPKLINTEEVFVPVKSYYRARRILYHRGWITISGCVGEGKTALAERLLVSFARKPRQELPNSPTREEKGDWKRMCDIKTRGTHQPVKVKSWQDWVRKVDPQKKQIILIDDIFGGACYTPTLIEEWAPYFDEIMEKSMSSGHNTLVIITVHRHFLEKMHPRFKDHPLFQSNLVIDLSKGEYKYSEYDRLRILEATCKHVTGQGHGMEFREEEQVRKVDAKGFGYASRLYCLVKSFNMQGGNYFRNPDRSCEAVMQKTFSFDKIIHFTLASLILFDGKIELDKDSFEEYDETKQNIFRQLKLALNVETVTLAQMRYVCTLMNGVFIQPVQLHHWEIGHERTSHLMCDALMKKLSKKMIELCSVDFLLQRLRTTMYCENLEPLCTVGGQDFGELAQRLTFELLKGQVRLIAAHPAFGDGRFAEHWAKFIAEMGTFYPVFEQRGDYNRSVFFWLAYYGQEAAIKYLFEQEEDMEDITSQEWFQEELNLSLFAACAGYGMNTGRLIGLLLAKGASLDARETLPEEDMVHLYGREAYEIMMKRGGTLLHLASSYGSYEATNQLVMAGADMNAKMDDGNTPLHRAAMNKHDSAFKGLTKHKADVNAKNLLNMTPLHEATRVGNDEAMRQLSWAGCKIEKNTKMNDGRSLLSVAAGREDVESISTIADAYGKPCSPRETADCWKALHEAIALGNEKIVKILLEKDVPYNEKCAGGWSPIHYAVAFNHKKIARMLLDKKAEVNSLTASKKTPLHIAAENGYWSMCDLLLDYGAKPENLDNGGNYAMNLAANNGHQELVKMFVIEGLELDHPRESMREREYMMRMMFGGRRMRDMYE